MRVTYLVAIVDANVNKSQTLSSAFAISRFTTGLRMPTLNYRCLRPRAYFHLPTVNHNASQAVRKKVPVKNHSDSCRSTAQDMIVAGICWIKENCATEGY